MTHIGSLFKVIGLSGFAVLAAELVAHIELIVSHTIGISRFPPLTSILPITL